jgi:hypothetical protein
MSMVSYSAAADEPCCCTVAVTLPEHHDRLLRVDSDVDELVELLELAVTWGELDYSGVAVLAPVQWLEFARTHEWAAPDRALRIFGLATDIALRSGARDVGPTPEIAELLGAALVR